MRKIERIFQEGKPLKEVMTPVIDIQVEKLLKEFIVFKQGNYGYN